MGVDWSEVHVQVFYWIGAYFWRLTGMPHLKGSQTNQQKNISF